MHFVWILLKCGPINNFFAYNKIKIPNFSGLRTSPFFEDYKHTVFVTYKDSSCCAWMSAFIQVVGLTLNSPRKNFRRFSEIKGVHHWKGVELERRGWTVVLSYELVSAWKEQRIVQRCIKNSWIQWIPKMEWWIPFQRHCLWGQ